MYVSQICYSLNTESHCAWLLHAEFRPGEPWKGYQNIDPETDPYVTPGSVMTNLSISTVRDLDLLRDRNNSKYHSHSVLSAEGIL